MKNLFIILFLTYFAANSQTYIVDKPCINKYVPVKTEPAPKPQKDSLIKSVEIFQVWKPIKKNGKTVAWGAWSFLTNDIENRPYWFHVFYRRCDKYKSVKSILKEHWDFILSKDYHISDFDLFNTDGTPIDADYGKSFDFNTYLSKGETF